MRLKSTLEVPTTKQERSADTVRFILEAARSLILAGRPDASLRAIATRAGVALGTLHGRFPTRGALMNQLHEAHCADQLVRMSAGIRALEALDVGLFERLRGGLLTYFATVRSNLPLDRAFEVEARTTPHIAARKVEVTREQVAMVLDAAPRVLREHWRPELTARVRAISNLVITSRDWATRSTPYPTSLGTDDEAMADFMAAIINDAVTEAAVPGRSGAVVGVVMAGLEAPL